MNIWQSIAGCLEIRITSADVPGILENLANAGIRVHRIQFQDDLTVTVIIGRSAYPFLKTHAEKRGDHLEIIRKKGLYWYLPAAKKRPVLLTGLVLFLLASFYLPTRVLFIQVTGNETIPARKILEAAETCGIRFGTSRREVRSEKVKNALLGALPQLQWAGVNTKGCVAVISVREREESSRSDQENGISSLVAARDGIIVSFTATKGSARCAVGQAVKEGEVLISGYTDCGLLLRATRAEGEILAQTRRHMAAVTLCERTVRENVGERIKYYSLLIGKKRINLYNTSGICDVTCGRMYEEYYITLPGGFVLPVAFAVDTHQHYESSSVVTADAEDCYACLAAFCDSYILSQMVSGTVLDCDVTVPSGSGGCRLDAEYVCLEMIGRRREERKVESYGKSD